MVWALGTLSTVAAGPKLSHFAAAMIDSTAGDDALEVKLDFASGVDLGGLKLEFEKTKLDDIKSIYGGESHFQGDAGNAVTWLCYTVPAAGKAAPTTVWFTSTSEMSGPGDTLSMVAVQRVDAAMSDGCAVAPNDFPVPGFAIPGVGASVTAIKSRFGAKLERRTSTLYFSSIHPAADDSSLSTYETIGYAVADGVVTAVAIIQVTTD